MSRWCLGLVVFLAACGLNGKINRLSDDERPQFEAVRVFMAEDEFKEYLSLKTEEERQKYMKDHGPANVINGPKKSYWDMYYQYDQAIRDKIATGEVQKGWTEDRVTMAWGPPFQRRRVTRDYAERSEVMIYRFEVAKDGTPMVYRPGSKATYGAIRVYQIDVHVDDGKVTDLIEKDKWDQ